MVNEIESRARDSGRVEREAGRVVSIARIFLSRAGTFLPLHGCAPVPIRDAYRARNPVVEFVATRFKARPMDRKRRVGLLGGSFNPAHGGHRRISLRALQALGLDEVWWLVSPGNPLKPGPGMATLAARVASARWQARRAPIRVTAIEGELGTRYTIDTLRALEEALEDFAGCAVIISHDRWFLDRLATHMLAFEGDSHVEWFEGNFADYEADKIRRLGADAVNPKRATYKPLTR